MKIFVSYRRDDSAGYAGRLYDYLSAHFGANSIFMDIDAIEPGEDFRKIISKAVETCDVVLVMLGKQWINITDAQGRRRLDNPKDWVRMEVSAALSDRRIRVIPVLVRDATMPSDKELPEGLKELVWRNAIELSDSRFQHDVNKLIRVIERIPAKKPSKISRPTLKAVPRISWKTILLASFTTLVVFVFLVWAFSRVDTGATTVTTTKATPMNTNVVASATVTQFIPVQVDESPVPIPTEPLILPTDTPLPLPTKVTFGNWLIVIGQFPSLSSAQNYILPFVDKGLTTQVFCRVSPVDSSQTPALRAAVFGFLTEG